MQSSTVKLASNFHNGAMRNGGETIENVGRSVS